MTNLTQTCYPNYITNQHQNAPDIPFNFVLKLLNYCLKTVYSLPNNAILDQPKLKGFAENRNKCDLKIEIYFVKGKKHCGEKEKVHWLPAFSPFPTMFSKGFF